MMTGPYTEVWDASCAPGGYVCGTPDPTRPDGICGMPVESEPCPDHAPADLLEPGELTAQEQGTEAAR
jgi:hypothetical protein